MIVVRLLCKQLARTRMKHRNAKQTARAWKETALRFQQAVERMGLSLGEARVHFDRAYDKGRPK